MKEEIRDYKLVRWYPSLPTKWDSTHSYQYNRKLNVMVNITLRDKKIAPYVQSMPLIEPDFIEYWEKNKPKPLFITEDGVEVFSDIDSLFAVNLTYFSKTQHTLRSSKWLIDNPSYKVFSLETNADEYIAWYKKDFSINDLLLADIGITTSQLDKLQELAKERIEE